MKTSVTLLLVLSLCTAAMYTLSPPHVRNVSEANMWASTNDTTPNGMGIIPSTKSWSVKQRDTAGLADSIYFSSTGTTFQGLGIATFKPRQSVDVMGWDTTDFIYWKKPKEGQFATQISWRARLSADTVYFRTPPKKIIVDGNSYSLLFLNRHWFIIMDPQPQK